jgi:hypothetical protein
MRWYGWYRRRESGQWIRAVEAESLEVCARLLDKATKGLRIKSINQIMTAGGYPAIGARPTEKVR